MALTLLPSGIDGHVDGEVGPGACTHAVRGASSHGPTLP